MCISVNPAEFSRTVIAHFPDSEEGKVVLSYTNTAQSAGNSSAGVANAGPNALIFPVYGSDVEVLGCPNPKESREYLARQGGLHKEEWKSPSNFNLFVAAERTSLGKAHSLQRSGNYLVGVAEDVEEIPLILDTLRRTSDRPEHVPNISEHLTDILARYYRAQAFGMPRFVIGAFQLSSGDTEAKNPITVRYTPAHPDKVILPALDYHGEGVCLEPYARRDHRLLISSSELQEQLAPFMPQPNQRPAEFGGAPSLFPLQITDTRKLTPISVANTLSHQQNPEFSDMFDPKLTRKQLEGGMAPNNDYVFDTRAMASELAVQLPGIRQVFEAELAADPNKAGSFVLSAIVAEALSQSMGETWAMRHSNQFGSISDYLSGHKAIADRKAAYAADYAAELLRKYSRPAAD